MANQEIKNGILDGIGNRVLGNITITGLDIARPAKQRSRAGLVPTATLAVALIAEACGGNATTATPGASASPAGAETPAPGLTLSPEMKKEISDVVKEALRAGQSQPPSSPDTSASAAPSGSAEALTGLEAGQLALPVPVPAFISGDMARAVRTGTQVDGKDAPMFTQGEWFNAISYNTGKSDQYRGIGPWYPVAFENIDQDAANLTTHGNVGELVISSRKGGKVMIAVMQLDKHQHEGAWGTNPVTGRFEQNDSWKMQYNFHSLQPFQEIWVVDPDTGKNLTWPDGAPVIYRANEQGIAAFAIPATKGNDARVGFVFNVTAAVNGQQPSEIKFERGPNDNPGKTGENPLPKDEVLKPMVPEK